MEIVLTNEMASGGDVDFVQIVKECAAISLPSVFLQVALLLPFTFSTMRLGRSDVDEQANDDGSAADTTSTSSICLSSFSISLLLGNIVRQTKGPSP